MSVGSSLQGLGSHLGMECDLIYTCSVQAAKPKLNDGFQAGQGCKWCMLGLHRLAFQIS